MVLYCCIVFDVILIDQLIIVYSFIDWLTT